ncbi:MAG: CHAD domain-containing protein [Planctomycetes bacterium]|nr:CHAD domain-containing protein [Planctomycetota bacterium]
MDMKNIMPGLDEKNESHMNSRQEDMIAMAPLAKANFWLVRVRGRIEQVGRALVKPETIHALRVATRRAEVALELIRPALKRKQNQHLLERLITTRKSADAVRNLDVVIGFLAGEKKATYRHNWLEQARRDRKTAVRKLVKFARKEKRFWRKESLNSPTAKRNASMLGIESHFLWGLAVMVARVSRKWAGGESIGKGWHALRVAAKKARYSLEQSRMVAQAEDTRHLIGILEEIHDRLGRLSDRKLMTRDLAARKKRCGRRLWESLLVKERAMVGKARLAVREWMASVRCRFMSAARRFVKSIGLTLLRRATPSPK